MDAGVTYSVKEVGYVTGMHNDRIFSTLHIHMGLSYNSVKHSARNAAFIS